ncbi:F-box domain-containing protein [Colletotrichum orchidophilum]|uniref:F-box domain-containing protein n=1 Tax=Colletotrichum orchidophilum TaxID=1209926 RepID=A0A1G4BDG8_9PEZI|nr:F-box domain-containing protein [Colletotrichum orchidophilum]OHE99489.1 F-box domain-containing protein [Colletotrichum orchidophilum]
MPGEHPSTFSPGLVGLPLEIQNHILEDLASSHPASIRAILLTSKQFYQAALHLSVQTYESAAGPKNTSQYAQKRSRNLDFLRYIVITKPQLAQYVRRITIKHVSTSLIYRTAPSSKKPLGPESDEIGVYADMIDASGLSDHVEEWQAVRHEWLRGLADGLVEQQIGLLFLACPRIEFLELGTPLAPRLLPRLIKAAALHGKSMKSPLLHHLREYYGEPEMPKSLFHFFNIGKEFLQLPQLRTFTCASLSSSGPNGHLFDEDANPPECSHVQNLTLLDANITKEGLSTVIRACRKLKSFHWTPGDSSFLDMQIKLQDLAQAMSPHRDNIECLHINYHGQWRDQEWYVQREGLFIGTFLRDMISLKTLHIGMEAFTGFTDLWTVPSLYNRLSQEEKLLELEQVPRLVNHIPPNLESLELHGCTMEILPHVQELVDLYQTGQRFANLRMLWLHFNTELVDSNKVSLALDRNPSRLDLKISYNH